MGTTDGTYREIAVPVSVFDNIRKELAREAGALPTIHALHSAGFSAGTAAADAFRSSPSEETTALGEDAFWSRLSAFFDRRGWGTLDRRTEHAAVGFLESVDWAESAEAEVSDEQSCSFSTGFLSGLLSAVASSPVAVLEVGCRGRGDDRCTFAFGSEAAVHELYGKLLDGADVAEALTTL